MFLKFREHVMGWRVDVRLMAAMVIGLGGFSNLAHGWQFREVDEPATPAVTEVEEADLAPTAEVFLAPVVDAAEFKQAAEAEAVKVKPQKNPEPVPMPELVELKPVEHVAPVVPSTSKNPPPIRDPEPKTEKSKKKIESATFLGVQPGKSTLTELLQAWGNPTNMTEQDDKSKLLVFHNEHVKQIEVTVHDNEVSSILVHLKEIQALDQVEEELGIAKIPAVAIPDELGEVLGQAYPERGLMLSFTEHPTEPEVAAILIENVSGEMFRLRATYDFEHAFTQSLEDLATAIRLDPKDAEAYWLQAQLQDAVGQSRDAIKSIQKAIRLRPTNATYRLTRARLYAKTNRLQSGLDEVRAVIDEIEMKDEVAAQAHSLLGDLLALGNGADHHAALKQHLKAIDLASKVVDDERFAIRRSAKQTLIDAHLSVARDISMGNFQRKSAVVPKWLYRAAEMADESIADDGGDELVQLHVFRETLAAYAEVQINNIDASVATEEAIETSRDMIAEATDEKYKMHIQRILAETLLHAARVNRSIGKHDVAMKYANNAVALLEDTNEQWDLSPHGQFLQSQLYFVLGSLHAIRDQDHAEAVEWYAKARSAIISSNTVSPLYSLRGHGEMYVSMGLSYWEVDEQDKAIQITQTGTELMSDAVESGSLQIQAMAVPYGNLAIMHSKMGRKDKSEEYASLVAKVEKIGKEDTIRK